MNIQRSKKFLHRVTKRLRQVLKSKLGLIHLPTMRDLQSPGHLASSSGDLQTVCDQITALAAKAETADGALHAQQEQLHYEIVRLREELMRLRQISIEHSNSLTWLAEQSPS